MRDEAPPEAHMSGKTSVIIMDEHTRRVVGFALWHVVSEGIVGERALSESFYDRAWRGIHPIYALETEMGEAEYRLARIGAVRMAVRFVEAAHDGARVELPVTTEELSIALRDCVQAIDQNDNLFGSLPADEQADISHCRNAANRLLAQLDREVRAELARDGWVELPADPSPPRVAVPEAVGIPSVRRLGGQASEDIAFPG